MSTFGRAAAGAIAALALWPAGADATVLTCGQVVTADTTLTADVKDCPGDGIVIGADGITLKLNGHTVSGTGTGTGVLANGRNNVVITDGTVIGFDTGIVVSGDNNRISKTRTFDTDYGIQIAGNSNTLQSNSQHRAANAGLSSGAGDGLWVDGNQVVDSDFGVSFGTTTNSTLQYSRVQGGRFSVLVINAPGAKLLYNTVVDYSQTGYYLEGDGSTAQVRGNEAVGRGPTSGGNGLVVNNASGFTLHGNQSYDTGLGLFVLNSTNITLLRNHARFNQMGIFGAGGSGHQYIENVTGPVSGAVGGGNSQFGIFVSNTDGVLVRGNTANRNGFFGVALQSAQNATVTDNVTNLNTFGGLTASTSTGASYGRNIAKNNTTGPGINVNTPNTDLGGNRASGNLGAQCIGVTCTP